MFITTFKGTRGEISSYPTFVQWRVQLTKVPLNRIRPSNVKSLNQYTLLSGSPVQTGQVLFEFKFTTAQCGAFLAYKKQLRY